MSCRRWFAFVLLGALTLLGTARGDEETLKSDLATLKDAGEDTDGKSLLEFFKKRTIKEETRKKIEEYVAQLGDDKWGTRATATQGLIDIGTLSRAMLVKAAASTNPEVARRARFALLQIGPTSQEAILLPCAARALVHHKPAGAADVLLGVLPSIEDAEAADEVASVLHLVALDKNKKPHLSVIAALKDRYPIKRFAAGMALARIGGEDHRGAVRKLLEDRDAGVRRRVAVALLESRDPSGVPTLINLLSTTNTEDVYAAEDALYTIAGDKAPPSSEGDSVKAREKYVKGWNDWWKNNEASLDLKKVDFVNALRNLTLIVTLDTRKGGASGTVWEMDSAGKSRWKIDKLQYPVYASMVRNDRVLICEYYGNRVTERDLRGNIKFTKSVNYQVVGAQRLRNGNTFIVTRNQLLEVDKDGKDVRTISRPSYDVVAAHKDNDGKITLVTNSYIIRLDAKGTQLSSTYLGRYISSNLGFKAHFLPKGGVVIPDYSYNKVREYDASGKMVWEADAYRPNSAVKLRNGNYLVASRYNNEVWEIDGKTKKKIDASVKRIDGQPLVVDKR